ncbi:MAG TPA: hypothetical protein ENK40_04345 [Gammaproteobacteria bacterium]|nr:hypothetical protein [Gammaproteobacteria bacterium]
MPAFHFRQLLLPGFLLLLVACAATTRLTSIWYDKQYAGPPMSSVMIIAVTENVRNRRIFEDALVKQFAQAGVKATASYALFPGVEKLDKDMIIQKSEQAGIDSIIVTTITAIENEELYYPPATTYVSPQPYYHNMWTYYPRIYETHTTPGYTVKYENVKLETHLYQANSGKLLWSAQSELFDPRSGDLNSISENLGWKFIKSLRGAGLIKK